MGRGHGHTPSQGAGSEGALLHSLQVELVAEAYSVDVDVTWPEEGVEGLDFKAFKVVDEQRSEMTLHNNGKYEVGYKVLLRKRPVRDALY